MIAIKNGHELEAMRQACKITAAARALAGEMVRPGMTTKQIDKAVHDFIVSQAQNRRSWAITAIPEAPASVSTAPLSTVSPAESC